MDIGGFSAQHFSFTVNAPASLDSAGAPYNQNYNDGYYTAIYYNTLDEFGNQMPSIALNEQFSDPLSCTNPVGHFCPDQNNNWNKPNPYGLSSYNLQGYWYDQIYFSSCTNCTPAYSHPQTPLSSNKVDYGTQTWRVGSSTVGTGVSVQTDTFQRYTDHGAHNGVVSPVN